MRGDPIHTPWNSQVGGDFDRLLAEVAAVFFVAVAHRLAARFPAAAVFAAGERADVADVLVERIRFPVGRLATAGDDDTGAVFRSARFRFHGGGQMHGHRHRAENAVGVIHQLHKLAEAGFANEIGHPFQRRMPMPRFAALHVLDVAAEMIDHLLEAIGIPPLGSEVVLPAGDDDPEPLGDIPI